MQAFLRLVSLAICLVFLTPVFGSAQAIDRIVFFGDSLSDSGNHFIATGESTKQPFTLDAPSASYDIGGHHYTNGATWAEELARMLHLPESGHPALRAPGVFGNYAVGRARARAGSEFPYFDLQTQVQSYLADVGGQVPPGTLVAIWIGGTDVGDALFAFSVDPTGTTTTGILNDALTATLASVGLLYAAGARMFLFVNIPDFAYTPYVRSLDASGIGGVGGVGVGDLATYVTNLYDSALAQLVNNLPLLLPADPSHPLQVHSLVDANALVGQIVASPSAFGITNATDRCTTPEVVGGALCSTPYRYLFWDAIHPTRTGHHWVAEAALQALPQQ